MILSIVNEEMQSTGIQAKAIANMQKIHAYEIQQWQFGTASYRPEGERGPLMSEFESSQDPSEENQGFGDVTEKSESFSTSSTINSTASSARWKKRTSLRRKTCNGSQKVTKAHYNVHLLRSCNEPWQLGIFLPEIKEEMSVNTSKRAVTSHLKIRAFISPNCSQDNV